VLIAAGRRKYGSAGRSDGGSAGRSDGGSAGRSDGGFTLVELLVAMTVLMIVVGALLDALDAGTRTEHRASDRIDEEQAVRLVLAQLTRDVRGATDIDATPPARLDLTEPGGVHVRWLYASSALTRLDVPSGGPATSGVSVGSLANGAAAPPFVLLDASGVDRSLWSGWTTTDVVRCAVAVRAQVVAAARPYVASFTETVTAELHARSDQEGCS